MKIGFFLGTFDPIHNGHIANIMEVLNKRLVDRIYIVPAIQNPFKEHCPSVNFDTRVKMCAEVAFEINRLLFNDFVYKQVVFVSDIERQIKTDVHYSYLTLEKLKEQFPLDELFIIGGSDVTKEIKTWKNSDWILDNFNLIKISRTGKENDDEDGRNVGIMVGSSDIRKMIENGENPYPYVPYSVAKQILENNYYKKVK